MENYYFISYSNVDGIESARQLADHLLKVPPSIPVWLDERELQPGTDWDEQIVKALRECDGLLFLMTRDSVHARSECKREWTRALRYKKPIIPLLFDREAEMPYRLEPRQYLDFTGNYDQALAALRAHIQWRASPEGLLRGLEERLSDAERDLPRAKNSERSRIEDEIDELKKEITAQKYTIANPAAAAQETEERIGSGLERERQPLEPVHPETRTKFINPPPVTAPAWFQDRHVETELVGDFLKDPALRLITVVGRGGVGKTAMVCRLLKALEGGHLPEPQDTIRLPVDGILYLSPKGLRQINLAHLYADLCKLLPPKNAELLGAIYRNPQAAPAAKMQALLEAFPGGRTVVLLDNFEEVVDGETGTVLDQELDEALRALLDAPEHGIKIILTTRVAPRELQLTQPGRQTLLELDEGLKSPFAENILKAMDADGKLGLRDAPDTLLALARERTQGYPRALEALQAILAVDRSTSLEEALAEAESLLPESVVEALVGEAFSRLDTLAQQVMQALATLAAPVPEAAVDYLLQPYAPDINSAPVLRRLVTMRFARREAGRFHLHQVDRSYALERLAQGEPADRETAAPPFTRYALLHRAAEYFEQIRTPRESWKSIDDLAPQLAEFEARVAGEEYDAAASVLLEIDFDYLSLWGHARLVAGLRERLQGRLTDQQLLLGHLNSLGNCYDSLGDYPRAIDQYEQLLALAREIGDRYVEGAALGNLGNCYYSLGDYPRAIDQHEQRLALAREIGNRYGEVNALVYLGDVYRDTARSAQAFEHYVGAIAIADETGNRQNQHEAHFGLALAHLFAGELTVAREAIDAARTYDFPENNAAMWTVAGIIRLRQEEHAAACEAFSRALAEANGLLEKSDQNFSALDTKALALCGLALCEDERHLAAATEAFRAARKITQARGVLTTILQQFDALTQADPDGILTPLRKAAAQYV